MSSVLRRSLSHKEIEALGHIRDRIVRGGAPPSVRELGRLLGFRSPNAAAYVLSRLTKRGFIRRREDGRLQLVRDLNPDEAHARTVGVPLVGTAPCGAPMLAEENIEAVISVSRELARPPYRYFLLRARGDSMDLAGIQDGDLVLVRQQPTAESGDRVVALVDDEATIKEFRNVGEAIALVPRSSKKAHQPIILTISFQIQGIVQGILKNWEKE